MLLNTKDLLKVAEEHGFTVGAYNVTELSNFKCVFETAEKLKAPTIVAVAESEFEFCGKDYFSYVANKLKESDIPFALHLDHGHSVESCMKAIQAGFTSVMIDGSSLPYEKNVEVTRKVVDLAHMVGVSVEGELGTIGNVGSSDEGVEEEIEIIYTQPEQLKDFVEKTDCDLVAVAIGTSHGLYTKGKEPKLQIELLKELKKVSNVPLVLHGGSSNLDEEIRKACDEGVRKINIASDYKAAISRELHRIISETGEVKFALTMPKAVEAGKKVVEEKMKLFNTVDKAKYY